MAKIKVYYQTTTPESAEIGDYEDQGLEYEKEIIPDYWDIEEAKEKGLNPEVYSVLEELKDFGALETSSTPFNINHDWFTTVDPVEDRNYFENSVNKTYSIFVEGLNKEQWEQLLNNASLIGYSKESSTKSNTKTSDGKRSKYRETIEQLMSKIQDPNTNKEEKKKLYKMIENLQSPKYPGKELISSGNKKNKEIKRDLFSEKRINKQKELGDQTMSKKYSMYSNGTVIAHLNKGKIRKASQEETIQYLANQLPENKDGSKLAKVMYNSKDGCIYGKYANNKVYKKQVIAQVDQSEPVDGTQKKKDTEVPRDDSKAKPEGKARDDAKKPKEVRTKEYARGKGGEELHSDVVPRKDKTNFEKETADKATSGKPDKYVQDLQDNKEPTPAGKEQNHVAGSEIKMNHDSVMYQDLNIAKGDKDKQTRVATNDETQENTSKRKMPWEKGSEKKTAKTQEQKTAGFEKEYKEAKKQLMNKEEEINAYKLRNARLRVATKYALKLRDLNPAKYDDADEFYKLVDNTASTMDVESIEASIAYVNNVKKEASTDTRVKTASIEDDNKGGLSTAIVMPPQEQDIKHESNDIKNILMEETHYGRMVKDFDQETSK